MDIASNILIRLEALSKEHKTISIFGFEDRDIRFLFQSGINLEYAQSVIYDMEIGCEIIPKENPYLIYLKIDVNGLDNIKISNIKEYNQLHNCESKFDNGEIWEISFKNLESSELAFLKLGKSLEQGIVNPDISFLPYNTLNRKYLKNDFYDENICWKNWWKNGDA